MGEDAEFAAVGAGEAADLLAAHGVADAAGNGAGVDAEPAGAVAVELDLEFLAAALGVDVDGEETGDATEAADGFFGDLEEGAGVFAVEVDRHTAFGVAAAARRTAELGDAGGHFEFFPKIGFDVAAVHGGGLRLNIEEPLHAAGEVGADEGVPRADEPLLAGVVAEAELDAAVVVAEAGLHAIEVVARGVGGEERFDLGEKGVGALHGSAGREIEVEIEGGLAAAAQAAGGHADFTLGVGEGRHGGDDDEEGLDAMVEHPVEGGDVAVAHPGDDAQLGVLPAAREALGGEGHEDQRDEERGEERGDDGQAEAQHPEREIAAALH